MKAWPWNKLKYGDRIRHRISGVIAHVIDATTTGVYVTDALGDRLTFLAPKDLAEQWGPADRISGGKVST